jgi:hypothetical protein
MGGTSICWRTTWKRMLPALGRRTVSATIVPFSPLISARERSNGIRPAGLPSMRTMTSPLRIPAARAGPLNADVTTSPTLDGPTVSPIPEYVPSVRSVIDWNSAGVR